MQHEGVKPHLMRVLVSHARHNHNHEQWSAVGERVQRAFAVISPQEAEPNLRMLAGLMKAASLVYAGSRTQPHRGITVLQEELAFSNDATFTAWMLADMAKYAAMAGQTEVSLVLAKEAWQTAKQSEVLTEVHLRRSDYGGLLLAAGRPEEALQVLPPMGTVSVWANIRLLLIMVEAHRQLGHFSEAHDLLQQAFDLIGSHREMEVWRPKANDLGQRF